MFMYTSVTVVSVDEKIIFDSLRHDDAGFRDQDWLQEIECQWERCYFSPVNVDSLLQHDLPRYGGSSRGLALTKQKKARYPKAVS